MLANMDLAGELPQIKCPVLVIGGEFDRGRPPARVEPIAQAIPGATFRVLPVGHYASLQEAGTDGGGDRGFLDGVGL